MNEKPILFSAPMMRAVLASDKTQTRRPLKSQPGLSCSIEEDVLLDGPRFFYSGLVGKGPGHPFEEDRWPCESPYGCASDRLYVRETFYAYGRWETRFSAKKKRDEWHFVDMTTECDRLYQYDTVYNTPEVGRGGIVPARHKRPSLFMPRVASRILLEITGVRVERLQDISEEDALAEGVFAWWRETEQAASDHPAPGLIFRDLWESINGSDSWAANPWVWVVEFKRIQA